MMKTILLPGLAVALLATACVRTDDGAATAEGGAASPPPDSAESSQPSSTGSMPSRRKSRSRTIRRARSSQPG